MAGDARVELSDEEQWLQAAAAGDRDALGRLYDRFAPSMMAVAQRVLGSVREAEDVVHDVFLEAWLRARHYDRARGSVQTWLMLRLRSRALDRLRAAQRRARLASESGQDAALDANTPDLIEHNADSARAAQHLHGWLAELKLEQRMVLELAYFEGCSLAEIATRLTLPIGTVKSRMSRAVTALRTKVEANAERRARGQEEDKRHD